MEIEIWKPVKGYEGVYSVSNRGRIRSEYRIVRRSDGRPRTIPERILDGKISDTGYIMVSIYHPGEGMKDGKGKMKRLHRLVAESFIPNPEKKGYINHRNGIKTDNRIENLEWCTIAENNKHARENGLTPAPKPRRGEENNKAKLIEEQVYNLIDEWNNSEISASSLGKKFGISGVAVRKILEGKHWAHLDLEITREINFQDNKGSTNGMSILDEDKVRFIRKNANLFSRERLAEMFGVSPHTIKGVIKRKSWQHIS